MNIVLMAGGGGTRLWPLSRQSRPKQFLDLGTGKTLIQMAYQRATSLVSPEHIFLATAQAYQPYIAQLLPHIPSTQIFYEPERRDTTAAFASVAIRLAVKGFGDEPTLFMWSDHVFTNEPEFLRDLGKIEPLLHQHPDHLVVMGHKPTAPETAFGYIKVKQPLPVYTDVFQVDSFTEKPDQATAEKFVTEGSYYWNLGYFSLRPNFLLQQLEHHNPELRPVLQQYMATIQANDEAQAAAAYATFPKVSIEYTFVEKATNIIAVTGDYGWSDVGNWSAVSTVFGIPRNDSAHNHHISVDSRDNYIYNTTEQTVSLIGLKDTVVVVTDDAILITDKQQSHKVKDIVQRLEKEEKHKLL